MRDNNIIQEAIDCLKRLHKENAELKAENARLKEEITHLNDTNKYIINRFVKSFAEPSINTELFEENNKYRQTLQEIKKIADAKCNECKYGKDGISCKYGDCGEAKLHLITQLITETESEG